MIRDNDKYVVLSVAGQDAYRFPNNYGASVIQSSDSYGGEEGLYEIAVLKFNSDANNDWNITYNTPVTDNVIGYVHTNDIEKHLLDIKALPKESKDEQ